LKEITMTKATLALTELAKKGADIDVLRQGSYFPGYLETRRSAEKTLPL
jgi:hypothetical protein